jgi:uncharacterized protein
MNGTVLLLNGIAWVGHTAVLVFSLNWWYGTGYPHKLLTLVRYSHGLLVVLFPIAIWQTFDFDSWQVDRSRESLLILLWTYWFGIYRVVCILVALGILPWITVRRLLYRPSALRSNHTITLDAARELGFKPAGNGKYRLMANLPGNDIFRVDFAEKTLALPNLPKSWDGLSILHITDLHLSGTPDRRFFELVADRCRQWEPDIVAFTGDTVDSIWHHRWIIPVLGRLRWKTAGLAILGNHDSWYEPGAVRRRLQRIGLKMLDNSWTQIDVRGVPMIVVGNEMPWFKPAPDLSDCPDQGFRLCLSHTPDNILWARENRMDLVLAGHNHGGQIRFPIFGSALVPSRYSRRYDCGVFDEGLTVLHVCRGLSGQHPLRFNCRPEVAKLVLRHTGADTASESFAGDS